MSYSVLLECKTPQGDMFDHIAELWLAIGSFLKSAFVDVFSESLSRILPQRMYLEIFGAEILMFVMFVFLIIGRLY